MAAIPLPVPSGAEPSGKRKSEDRAIMQFTVQNPGESPKIYLTTAYDWRGPFAVGEHEELQQAWDELSNDLP